MLDLGLTREVTLLTVLIRLILSFAIGAAIGLERSAKNRSAGLRTHILVALGACIASLTGHYIYLVANLPTDLTRLGAQVVTGLGFIGAGTIIVTRRNKVKGLTTTAGLWATGVIGLAVGAGFWEGALVAAILVLITEVFFSKISKKIVRPPAIRIRVTYADKKTLDDILRCCRSHTTWLSNMNIRGKTADCPFYTLDLSLRSLPYTTSEDLLEFLRAVDGVDDVNLLDGDPV